MLNIKNLFNESYYLAQNPDVAKAISSGIIQSGLDHFQKFGQFEGRNFSASFDTNYYLQQNQDVAAVVKSGQISAVGHFLQYGQIEGRNPNIFFDTNYYLQQNPDVAAVAKSGQISAVEHFLQYGQIEKRNPGKFFDTSYYLQQNPDIDAAVKSSQITAFDHFLQFGEKEGRNAIASYDNKHYLKRYSDVADAVGKGQLFSAYRHFVVYGESVEKRFGVNTAPVAMDDTNSTIEGTTIKISVLANDTDLNKDTLSITNFTQATQGQVVDNKDGTFTYTPKSDFTGSDSFNYTITDSYDGIATGKVNLNVVQKPSVTLALASNSVLENGNTGLAYTFTRTNVTDNALTVNFNVTGDAVFGKTGADYTQLGAATFASGIGTVMFKPGEATATVTLTPVADTLVESDETVGLTLSNGTNYTVGTATPVIGTIKNDDTSVTLALASNSVLENSGTGLAYTFTRTGVTDNALTVNFNVGGDALFGVTGADYTQSGAATFASGIGTVMFNTGETTKTVTLTPVADTDVELDEKVILTLATGTNYTLGTTTPVTGTIRNDDTSVTLAVAPDGVKEDSGTGLVYTFTRTGVTDNQLTVNFGVGGTATFGTTGTDYTQSGPTSFNATSGTVTFAANQTTKTVTLTPKTDSLVEPDETIALTLKPNGTSYTIGTTTPVIGTIKNDDTSVTVAVAPIDGVKEDSGTPLVYTFTRTGAIDNDLSVNFNVGGNAVFDNDYDLSGADSFGVTSGTVMFKAGESTATVSVTAIADTDVETNETVTLSLGSGTGYTLGTTTSAIGTIKNDDTLVTLTNTTSNNVDENSGTPLVYTFTRTGVTDNELTVNFGITETASANDYTQSDAATFGSGTGTVTFAANELTKTVTLTPVADNEVEADETIALTLTNGAGYNVGTTTAVTSTIKNDDTLVTLAVSPTSVLEDSGTGLVYAFTRTVASDRPLTVNFGITGTASANDYTQTGAATFASGVGRVMFGANELTKTVTLTPVADSVVEADETVALTLTNRTNYTVGTTTAVTSTIKNDDQFVGISAFNPTATEGGTNGIYRISRGDVTTGISTVNLAIDNTGTYKASTNDYTLSAGNVTLTGSNLTVTIADGQSYVDVNLAATDDVQAEADETLKLNLAAGSGYTIDSNRSNATVTIAANDTVVINSNDSVNDYTLREGSLRQALLNAIAIAGPNTITFQQTTPQTITLAAALPTITGTNADNTTIDGGSAANLTVSGNNLYRVFDVNGVSANFKNLTIADGKASDGAGINQIGGTVNVTNSILSNNLATIFGGGIASGGGILTVSGSTFSGNTAPPYNNGIGGSAIDLTSTTATVTNSTFTNNTGGTGAIHNELNSSTLTIAGSTFTNNSPKNVYGSYTNGGGNNI